MTDRNTRNRTRPEQPPDESSPLKPTPPEPARNESTPTTRSVRGDPLATVLTPIANPTDGSETARALRAYLPSASTIYVAHVVEKGEGVPDKAGVEQRLGFAERTYDAFTEELTGSAPLDTFGSSVTPVTLYGRNVPRTILAGARDVGATAVVFTPRGGGRWAKLLTGSVAETLIRESEIPVVALPRLRERLVLE